MLKTVKQACDFDPQVMDCRMSEGIEHLSDLIDDEEQLGELMDQYIKAQKQEAGFDIRYNATLRPETDDWQQCAQVLSRRDFVNLMTRGWNGKAIIGRDR